MAVHLSEHFTNKNIFKITIAPIAMMVFISLYGVVDGLFVANFAGENAYAGLNLIMPIIMIVGGMGFMFGTGGSALSAKFLGEQNKEMASKVFTMMFYFTIIVGAIFSLVGFFLIEPLAKLMASVTEGSTQAMVDEAIKYGRVLMLGQVGFMTQNLFHSYFMVAEKPKLGFLATFMGGVTNMIFDAIFIVGCNMGVEGAAYATILGYVVGFTFPIIYFLKAKTTTINFVRTRFEFKHILQSCWNGSSEFVNNVSTSIVSIVFNIQLLKFFGQNGVAAYGTIMYLSFVFMSIYIGYSIGMAPVVGYNFGAQNKIELRNVLKRSIVIILVMSVCMFSISFFGSPLLAKLFSSGDETLEALSTTSLKIYSVSYMFAGISIFISCFFTALNNGLISALNSFLRTLVFQVSFVFILPLIFGENGVWWAMVGAEFSSICVALISLKINQKKYGY